MKIHEIEAQEKRIAIYRKLEARRNQIDGAIRELEKDWPNGPYGSGPFTGNTRESRQIQSLDIAFTHTRGGAAPCQLKIDFLFVEAYEFSLMLIGLLKKQRAVVTVEMENL